MEHIFEASSCLFCGADDHDIDLPEKCPVEREPMKWTSETGDPKIEYNWLVDEI